MLILSVILLLGVSVLDMNAQALRVSGTVFGSGGGREIGAVVSVKGNTSNATMTDIDGHYSIEVPGSDAVLVYSLLGYKTAEIPVSGRSTINVTLEEEATALDEVVVVGYGTQRKEFVVGSVSQVTSKDLMKAPVTNVQNMMTGRLSGMTSIQSTGTPGGDQTTMLVRGYTTFNNSSPLCIVDGVERPMTYLNPNDIASISVLKDAATAAIYGVKGANGVILVTTKSGAQGNAKISYDGSVTFDTNTAMPEMLNAQDYIYWHNLARELDGQAPYWTDEKVAKMKEMGVYGETDWLEEIYKKFGLTHQHNVSVAGGTDKVKYFASVGIMDQDGILRNTSFTRYNVRGNIDAQIAKNLHFTINLGADHADRSWPGYSIANQSEFSPVTQAFYAVPVLAKEYKGLPLGYTNGTYTFTPLAALTDSGYQDQDRWNFNGTTQLEYAFDAIKPLKGLKASIFVGFNYYNTLDRNYMTKFDLYKYEPGNQTLIQTTSLGISENNFTRSASYGYNMTIRPQITYNRTFGRNNISFIGFFERYQSYGETMTGYKTGFYTDYPVDISMGLENLSPYVSGSFDRSGMASFAARLGYAFDEKYLVEATMRADGSYKFAPENRWGYFPSVAVGWVMSKEDFFTGAKEVVDFLKIKASYGMLGSDDTDPYLYMQTFKTTAPSFSYVINGSPQSTFYTSGYVYDNLTWSRTNTYNAGFEARMFKNKLTVEFDWFYKYTSRILESESGGSTYAPSLGGNNPVWLNSGRMDNRGFELTLRHDNWFSNGWSYSLTGILSWSRNKVLSKKISDNHPSYRAILGQPIGSIYGFNATGLFQTEEQVASYPVAPSGWVGLGELMYEDINGDGKINQIHDYVKIGRSRVPEMIYSLNADITWKNITLTALFQGVALCNYQLNGVYGNGNCDSSMYTRPFYGGGNAPYYLVENSWRPDNTDAAYPRLSANVNANNAWSSSWWVRNGAYVRLKNLQLTYALPDSVTKKIGMNRAAIYVAGTNLLTISDFKYVDPENPGINNGYYPQQRTFSIGLNLTF